jgi:hypothetical protein
VIIVMKQILAALVFSLSLLGGSLAQEPSKENPVKINVLIPRGKETFRLKANKAWRNLFAGTQNSLPTLFKALKRRNDIVVPESVGLIVPDPMNHPEKADPNVVEVKKQTANPQLGDCTVLQELRKIVEAYINPKRKITWQISGKPHPCLNDVGFAKL